MVLRKEFTTKSDRELVEAVRAGETTALEELAERYSLMIRIIGRKYEQSARSIDVDDLVQDCLLKLLKNNNELQNVGAWLRRVANNHCITKIRRGKPLNTNTLSEYSNGEELVVYDDMPDCKAIQAEDQAMLREKIAILPALYRVLIIAYYYEGNSLREIAAQFGRPVGTVKRQLFEARERLRGELAEAA
jgi:RNA polymerase sigma-70 factor (ECF subfamily)